MVLASECPTCTSTLGGTSCVSVGLQESQGSPVHLTLGLFSSHAETCGLCFLVLLQGMRDEHTADGAYDR